MYHMEVKIESAIQNIPPKIQFSCGENWSIWLAKLEECVLKMSGPLYSITTNAPVIDTIVPNTLAWLLEFLQCTSSILKQPDLLKISYSLNI